MKARIIARLMAVALLVLVSGNHGAARFKAGPGLARKGTLAKAENMKIIKLKNGVQAVLVENHSAPVVALQVWVKAGAGDESDAQAGIAHLIEHMMFKGSEKFPAGELANQIESKGGILNAFTSSDFTVYWTVISSRFYETSMELFADAVFNPRFDSEELDREREVVLEEIRRGEDNPRNKLYDQLMSLAFKAYPYRRPVIGYQDTVSGFERESLMRFFNCHYRPANMIVVLDGDFDPAEAIPSLKNYFGQEKKNQACEDLDQRKTVEPLQAEMRLKLEAAKLNRGYFALAYKIPPYGDPDMAGLDLLSVILGEGESSRLTEKVRNQEKLVDEIWSYAQTPRGPGLLIIGASLELKNLEAATLEILGQVNLLKQKGVEDWELDRAKRLIESEAIYTRETMEGNARRIGFFTSIINDPDYEKKYLDQVEKVTTDDIKRVAEKYLAISSITFSGILPAAQSGDEDSLKKNMLAANAKPAEPLAGEKPKMQSAELWPIPSPAKGREMVSAPKRFILKNGIRVLVRENHCVPLVSVRAGFPGGVRFENDANNGVFNLLAEMFTEGAKELSSADIHRQSEALAANITGFSGRNNFGLTMTVPSPNFNQAIELFAALLKEPSFPKKEFERMRALSLAALKREQDQPRIMAQRLFLQTLYQSYPFRLNPLGSEDSLKKLKRDDLAALYKRFGAGQRLVIGISGDVNADQVRSRLEQLFADFNQSAEAITPPLPEPGFSEPRVKEVPREAAQTQIVFGWLGTTLSAADEPAMEVFSEILGGMSGRLFVELRDKKSLAYEVSAFHLEGLEPGYISGYIGCAPGKKDEALKSMLQEFERMKTSPASEDEISRAKNSLIGSHEIELQNNLNIASHLFADEIYELGFGYWQGYAGRIQKVSWQDLQAVAGKYLTSGYALAVLNPAAAPLQKSPEGSGAKPRYYSGH